MNFASKDTEDKLLNILSHVFVSRPQLFMTLLRVLSSSLLHILHKASLQSELGGRDY